MLGKENTLFVTLEGFMSNVIKCARCDNARVRYFSKTRNEYYCTADCCFKKLEIKFVRNIMCETCGHPIGDNGVMDMSGIFYCSTRCALQGNGVEPYKDFKHSCIECGIKDIDDANRKFFMKDNYEYCHICAYSRVFDVLRKCPNHEIANQTMAQALKTLGFEEVKEDEKE